MRVCLVNLHICASLVTEPLQDFTHLLTLRCAQIGRCAYAGSAATCSKRICRRRYSARCIHVVLFATLGCFMRVATCEHRPFCWVSRQQGSVTAVFVAIEAEDWHQQGVMSTDGVNIERYTEVSGS